MQKFNVVLAADNGYVQHLVATISSMLENTQHAQSIIINIIDGGISEPNKDFLSQLTDRYSARIQFLKIKRELLKDVVVNGHITEATYYRILIPALFDDAIEKVIYLDCDLLVRQDIYELWNTDIGDCAIGAVRVNEYNRHEQLGISNDSKYFNAGVLLINLTKWRKSKVAEQVLQFITKYPERLKMWDQDALNAVLCNDWQEIDYIWNLRSQVFNLSYKEAGFESMVAFEDAKNNPAIVHFTTASKPWHYLNNHPYKEEYFKYLNISRFSYIQFPEKEFLLNKQVIVFGTGKGGEQITQRLLKQEVNIAYFVDNNQEKWGKQFLGKIIHSPLHLLHEESKFIIIASQYDNEIAEQLENMGLKECEHFLKNLDWNTRIITK